VGRVGDERAQRLVAGLRIRRRIRHAARKGVAQGANAAVVAGDDARPVLGLVAIRLRASGLIIFKLFMKPSMNSTTAKPDPLKHHRYG
jgi:hypothetical protein